MSDDDFEQLRTHFKLVCKKCGSENVTHDVTAGRNYESGYVEGTVSLGCADCKQNDFVCSQ